MGVVAYEMPIGIPDPANTWGALDPIRAAKPNRTAIAPGWFEATPRVNSIAAGDAHDCYYIDNTHPSATDTNNIYGKPTQPRLTIPSKIFAAGSYIEIHGDGASGTNTYATVFNPRGAGTATSPIWVVGIDQPILSAKLDMGAVDNPGAVSYILFDGIYWMNGGKISVRPRFPNNSIDHIAFRNCVMKGTQLTGDGTGVSIGASAIGDPSNTTQDIVVYKCEIYNWGNMDSPSEECGVYPKMYVTRFWVLDSNVHDVAEDGLAGSHGGKHTSSGYYIGRNRIHDNLTNGIDIKAMRNVVISENTIYNHYDIWVDGIHRSSGIGEAVVVHYAGSSSGPDSVRNFPEDVTICFNTIYNARFGLRTSKCGTLRVIGNVIYNMLYEPSREGRAPCYAIELNGNNGDQWVVNNTIYGSDGGLNVGSDPGSYNPTTLYYAGTAVSYSGSTYVCTNEEGGLGIVGIAPTDIGHWKTVRLQIWGNIVSGRVKDDQYELKFAGSALPSNSVDMDYNTWHRAGGEAILYGGSTVRDLGWIRVNTPHDSHSQNGDPLFTNTAGRDFTLRESSPARAASTEGRIPSAYSSFQALFNLPIKFDRTRYLRPLQGGWSTGAFERQGPAPPQNLRIVGTNP